MEIREQSREHISGFTRLGSYSSFMPSSAPVPARLAGAVEYWVTRCKLPKDRFVNFSTISIGAKNHVPGMAMTVLKGGGARVGMEDNIYYGPGELLKSNAQ